MSKIVILSGTNRPKSNTSRVVAHIHALYEAQGQPAQILDLVHLPPELFLGTSYAQKPAAFLPFADAILESRGIHLVTPEYNGGMPGVLKYFIDMLKFPESFEAKPVCFTGLAAGMWGALRPVEQLQAIFSYRNAHILPQRVFLPTVNGMLTPEGDLMDEVVITRLRDQVKAFVKFTAAVRDPCP